jgi:hypothetical protein
VAKVEFRSPYKSWVEAINDGFAKWPTSKQLPKGGGAAWADMHSGARERLKRSIQNKKQKEIIAAGKEVLSAKLEAETDKQLSRDENPLPTLVKKSEKSA